MINLYKTMVRPHLEYCVPAWSPHCIKDKLLLEKVQHRFTRLLPGFRSLSYEERLHQLRLWALEERRNRADLIEVFKNGYSSEWDVSYWYISTNSGHSLKLIKYRCNKDVKKYFFSFRVISKWNMLDDTTVTVKSVNSFKTKLEMERKMKMGLFLDWSPLDLEAVTDIWSGRPASILQVYPLCT